MSDQYAEQIISALNRRMLKYNAALEDLWSNIGAEEIRQLQAETVTLCKRLHETLWHTDPRTDDAATGTEPPAA